MSVEQIQRIFEERIPFHRFLGLRVAEAADGKSRLEFDSRPELVVDPRMPVLHGGIIASVLDVVGSIAVLSRFVPVHAPDWMGTVDLRVDYLRPAAGKSFTALGELVRPGRSIAVTRMELLNEKDELLAMGTATFRITMKGDPGPRGKRSASVVARWFEEGTSS